MTTIYVLDTETTGLYGACPRDGQQTDRVVDIGICAVDPERGTVHDTFGSLLGYNVDKWDEEHRNAWIFQHTDITLDAIRCAPPASQVIAEVRRILEGQQVTSYNIDFDLTRFLAWPPWSVYDWRITVPYDIMVMADAIEEIPRSRHEQSTGWRSWPRLQDAYDNLCPDDPAEIHGAQLHRALQDARMAGYLLVRLEEMEAGNQ